MAADTLQERFDQKYIISPDGCWLWTAALNKNNGYGVIGLGGRGHANTKAAHRVSYKLHIGPIPEKLYVLHKCDNPPCVNPDHLFLGTQLDNMDDMIAKGRNCKGEAIGTAKLTEKDVLKIRSLDCPQKEIADIFKIDQGQVSRIRTRKCWKHVK